MSEDFTLEDVRTELAGIVKTLEDIPKMQSDIQWLRESFPVHQQRLDEMESKINQLQRFKNGEMKKETHTPDTCTNTTSIRNIWRVLLYVNIPLILMIGGAVIGSFFN